MKKQTKNKMTGKVILCFLFATCSLFTSVNSYSQGAAINTTGASADNSAGLDISFPDKGLLIPRITETQRNAIQSPAFGLQIFNTTTGCFNFWTGSAWKKICGDCDFAPPVAGNSGSICEGSTLNLTATSISGATYQWTGPNSFTSTLQNPVISNAAAGASGTYSVIATKSGCSSQPQTTIVTVNAAPAAPAIANNGPLCSGQNLMLSTSSVTGATYSWTGPNSFTANTQNATLSNVTNANAGAYLLVETVNGCVSSAGSTILLVYSGSPSQPGAISGATSNLGGQNNVTYSISPVNFATTYAWTVPVGASITGGQGGTSITVDFTCSGSGNIVVTASNACGTSPQQTLGVSTVLVPPGTISGPTTVTKNSTGNVYSITPVPFATAYYWTVPAGATITAGTGTASITVTFGNSNLTDNINVSVTSPCGTNGQSTLIVNIGMQTFSYTGSQQTFSVPTGVNSLLIEVWGAGGGTGYHNGSAGLGGYVYGNKNVTSGQVLFIYVGGQGTNGNSNGVCVAGGWNGGGRGGDWGGGYLAGGSGGGASDVRIGGTDLSNRIIVAGAGAGGSADSRGGNGGYTSGTNGQNSGGNGGTQSAGGYGDGSSGSIGIGGNAPCSSCAGGGGGGYYGGGAMSSCNTGGGGCCSSWFGGMDSGTGYSNGIWSGNGKVVITY